MGIIKTIIVGGEGLTEKQEKIRKLFMYLVSGCLTTAVNWICYVAFDKLVKADMMVDLFGKEVFRTFRKCLLKTLQVHPFRHPEPQDHGFRDFVFPRQDSRFFPDFSCRSAYAFLRTV